jgi:hypothetical protein
VTCNLQSCNLHYGMIVKDEFGFRFYRTCLLTFSYSSPKRQLYWTPGTRNLTSAVLCSKTLNLEVAVFPNRNEGVFYFFSKIVRGFFLKRCPHKKEVQKSKKSPKGLKVIELFLQRMPLSPWIFRVTRRRAKFHNIQNRKTICR